MTSLPLKPIRDLLTQDFPDSMHITDDAILALRDTLEDIIHRIGCASLREFDELNGNREQQGLRTLKRLNSCAVKKACDNILKPERVNDMGLQSQEIISLGDKNMARHTLVTKSAKKDSEEHGGINGL